MSSDRPMSAWREGDADEKFKISGTFHGASDSFLRVRS